MPKSERFEAELIFETKQLKSGVNEATNALKNFESSTSKIFDRFGSIAETNIAKIGTQLESLQNIEVGAKLQDLANTGQRALGSFLGAASQVEQFRLTLTTLTGSVQEADVELKKLQDFAGSTPFELKDVVAAGVKIKSLGVDVDRFLPLAGDLASVFNRDIKDSAQALAKALSGSQDGIQVLADSFGIAKKDLIDAGAAMKGTGAIALDSSGDLSALADAIERVAQQKNFTGAIGNQLQSLQGNTSQLSDAAFSLAAAIGDSLIPAFIPLVQTATALVSTISQAPKPVLALVGGMTALATALAAGGAGFLTIRAGLAGIAPLLSALPGAFTATAAGATAAGTAAAGAGTAFSSMLGPIGLLAAVIGTGLLFAITDAEQSSLALGAAIAKESTELVGAAGGFRQYKDAIATATGASREFVTVGQNTAEVAGAVGKALEGISGADAARKLSALGITYSSVSEDIDKATKRQDLFLSQLRDLNAAKSTFDKIVSGNSLTSFDPSEISAFNQTLQDQFGTTAVSAEKLEFRINQFNNSIAQNASLLRGLLDPTKDKLGEVEAAYKKVQAAAGQQLAELKITANTDDLSRSNAILEETKGRITQIKGLLAGQGVDVSSLAKIQDALAGTSNKGEQAALTGLLDLLKQRASLEKQSADISSKATKQRVDAALEEARAQDSGQGRIAALRAILATETELGAEKKRIIAEISREEKSLAADQKRASSERINDAIAEASQAEGSTQQRIAALQRILGQYELEGSVRRRILNDISRAEKQLEAEREQRRQAEDNALSGEFVRQQELILQSIDERIGKLQEEASAGKAVGAELEAALAERTNKEVELLQYKTQERIDAADSDKVASEIEKTGALEVEAARRKGIDAIEDQKKAQDERIKKIKDERKEALKGIKDESDARTSASRAKPSQPVAQSDQSNPTNAPGRSLEQLAQDLSGFSADSSRARADEIREQNRKPDTSFADLNPEIFERISKEDAARKEQIAKQDADRQEAISKRNEERQKSVADKQAKIAKDNASFRTVDAAQKTALSLPSGKDDAAFGKFQKLQAEFNSSQGFGSIPGLDPTKIKALPTVAPIVASPLKTTPAGEKSVASGKAPESTPDGSRKIEFLLGVEFDGQTVKSASVKRKTGIDGQFGDLQRTASGISLKGYL